MTRVDGSEDFDFYDVATGLRAGSINTRESQMGTLTTTSTEGDYKKFGTLLHATKVTQKVMGIEQVITLTSVSTQGRCVRVRAPRRSGPLSSNWSSRSFSPGGDRPSIRTGAWTFDAVWTISATAF